MEENLREYFTPIGLEKKEKLHRKALPDLPTLLKICNLASRCSFQAGIQVCGEQWKP